MIRKADVVVGLAWGDEAKGKIASELASKVDSNGKPHYSMVARWAGGNNAGHTVYVDGSQYKTHLVPSGVFHGVKSLIGPACVLHPSSFYKEPRPSSGLPCTTRNISLFNRSTSS